MKHQPERTLRKKKSKSLTHYDLDQGLSYSHLLHKADTLYYTKPIMLTVVLYGCETCSNPQVRLQIVWG
jgi:hypothetical protein